jgi:hypothetical protein
MVRIRLLDGQILQGKVLRPGVVGINIEWAKANLMCLIDVYPSSIEL